MKSCFFLIRYLVFRSGFYASPNHVPTAEGKQRKFVPIENSLLRLGWLFWPTKYPPSGIFGWCLRSTYPLHILTLFVGVKTQDVGKTSELFEIYIYLTGKEKSSYYLKILINFTRCLLKWVQSHEKKSSNI